MSATDSHLSPLGALFVAALRGEGTEAQILEILRPAVESAPDDTVVVQNALGPVAALRHQRRIAAQQPGRHPLHRLAGLGYAVGLLGEEDIDAILARLPSRARGGLLRLRIHRLVEARRLDEAHQTAEQLPEPLQGHRDIGLHLARAGDVELFFAEWPRLEPRRKSAELVTLREELVQAVARREGHEAALALVDGHRRLGDRYAFAALSAGRVAEYDELAPLLDGPLGRRLDEPQRVRLLVDQLLREVPQASAGPEDHRVLPLAERIGELAGDRDVVRVRDGQLVRLWPVIADEATLRRVRALIRTPNMRRELHTLLRDVPLPS